jgi:hypothetical protein
MTRSAIAAISEYSAHGMFVFGGKKRQQRYVVPAGFKSTWVTVALEDLK